MSSTAIALLSAVIVVALTQWLVYVRERISLKASKLEQLCELINKSRIQAGHARNRFLDEGRKKAPDWGSVLGEELQAFNGATSSAQMIGHLYFKPIAEEIQEWLASAEEFAEELVGYAEAKDLVLLDQLRDDYFTASTDLLVLIMEQQGRLIGNVRSIAEETDSRLKP